MGHACSFYSIRSEAEEWLKGAGGLEVSLGANDVLVYKDRVVMLQ